MSWDDDKNVNPGEPDGEITADEWDNHVAEHREIYDPDADEVTADVNNELVSTEVLGNAQRYINSDISASQLNNVIDAISTDENGIGGTIEVDPEVTVTSTNESITVKSDVLIDFNGATVRLADDLNDDAPPNGLIRWKNDTLTTNAHVRNVECDGNLANNSSFTDRQHRQGINLHKVKIDSSGNPVAGVRPERCTVRNVYAHDTIASNAVIAGVDCSAEDLWLHESGDDHWLYLPGSKDNHISNVWCSGAARTEGITIGPDAIGTTLENVHISNVNHTAVGGTLSKIIHARDPATGGDADARDNTLKNITIEVSDPDEESYVEIESPLTIENMRWEGAMNSSAGQILRVWPSASGSTFDGIDINLTGGTAGGQSVIPAIYDTGSDGVSYRGITIKDNASNYGLRGYFISDQDAPLNRMVISDFDIDVGSAAFRISGDSTTDGVSELTIQNGTATGGVGTYDVSGAVTPADGTMIPCDVTTIANTYAGRTQYNDGTTGTEGPCHYTSAGSWVSDVDGTTIA